MWGLEEQNREKVKPDQGCVIKLVIAGDIPNSSLLSFSRSVVGPQNLHFWQVLK